VLPHEIKAGPTDARAALAEEPVAEDPVDQGDGTVVLL